MRVFNKQKTVVDWGKPDTPVKLRLSNFSWQSLVSVERILEEINRIPSHHLAGLKEICYDPYQDTLAKLDADPRQPIKTNAMGMYLQGYRTIAVYKFNSEKELFKTLFHELGHYVYYTIIGSVVKKKWVTEAHCVKQYVTRYASRNASEDFAECYAEFLLNPANLQRIPKKYNFIRTEVFNNIPYHNNLNREY